MTVMALLPGRSLSEAKAHLSDVMSEVVHQHRPVVIERHRGKESMILWRLDDMQSLLSHFRFDPQVSFEDGECVIHLRELDLIAGGEVFEQALDELIDLVEQYSVDYIARFAFYSQTDRAAHAPYLARFALTEPTARHALFVEPPSFVQA